jgi:Sulfatase
LKVRLFLEGAGVAVLCLVTYYWPLLSPYHLTIYHDPLSVSPIAGGLAIDLVLACVLAAAVFAVLDRYSPEQTSFVWAGMLAFLSLKAVDFPVFLLGFYHVGFRWDLTIRKIVLFVMVGIMLLLWHLVPRALQKITKAARAGFAILGCCIFWMLPQLIFIAEGTHEPSVNASIARIQSPRISSDRVIWILLDELSYDQVFEHRDMDVKLPHFDRLSNESVSFSNIQPAGEFTEKILPSLFLGRKVDDIRSSLQRDLYVHDAATARWKPFDKTASLFSKAQQLGWTTGIAGWYNPYCHILEGVLDSCYWQSVAPFPHKLSEHRSAVANALAFPADLLLAHVRSFDPNSEIIEAHAQEYKDLLAAAGSLIQNETIRLVFIHLPIPHPPGIYSRKTGTLGAKGTYLDNLVLADKTLENLLDVIQRTAAGPRTTLVISSDHSWRTYLWRNIPLWTKEEERVSAGRFDPRPVLLIHFPGENVGELRSEPFPELEINSILLAKFRNELYSRSDLDKWLDAHSY